MRTLKCSQKKLSFKQKTTDLKMISSCTIFLKTEHSLWTVTLELKFVC